MSFLPKPVMSGWVTGIMDIQMIEHALLFYPFAESYSNLTLLVAAMKAMAIACYLLSKGASVHVAVCRVCNML